MSSSVSDTGLRRAHIVLITIANIVGIAKCSQIFGRIGSIGRVLLPDLKIHFLVGRKPALLPELT